MHGLGAGGSKQKDPVLLCAPAVFHVSWTLTRLTCGAKKHVSVGLLLGHYRLLRAAQLQSGMTIYVMYIILHYVAPILSAVCNTRS